ncbi:uncharacterized protein LOC134728306 isoform X2 [Mytilus trossulus]
MTTTSPVLTPTSVQPRDSRKCLFQSPTDTTTRKELPGFVTPLGTSHILSQKRNRRVVVFSPLKGTNYKSPPKKKRRQPVWTQKELCSLVEFVALHKDLQSSDNEWPAMNADNIYWTKASDFIKQTCGSVRSTISCRAKIVNHFRITYSTIDEAEEEFLINYEESSSTFDDSGFIQTPKTPTTPATSTSDDKFLDYYTSKFNPDQVVSIWQKLGKQITDSQLILSLNSILNEDQLLKLISTSSVDFAEQSIKANFKRLSIETKKQFLDQMFESVAEEEGLKVGTANFTSLSLRAMKTLKENSKPNVVTDFVKCLGTKRPNSQEPLMPVTRMPFGLIQHQIQFFCASDIRQISIPDDYFQWLETLDAEFEDKLGRILRGPMWSGQPANCIGKPLEARVNLAAVSRSTLHRRTSASAFTDSPAIQIPAIKLLTEVNPEGQYWLKLDGTDLKDSLQHSVKDVWNGDVNLNDGKLDTLREQYESRLNWMNSIHTLNNANLETGVQQLKIELEYDCQFLEKGFQSACNTLQTKVKVKTTNAETLKSLNWEVVEFNQLLQDCTEYQRKLQNCSMYIDLLKSMKNDFLTYLKNLFKKKRTAASHVLVIAISDEKRSKKPYTLPIQYIPYKSLRDQQVRDLTTPIKKAMAEAGLKVVGTVTDGEFNSLRSQGDTGPLHIWQLIHDSREAVRKMSKLTLISMLTYVGEDENGNPFAERSNDAIPGDVIVDLKKMKDEGLSFQDSIVNFRRRLIPDGYEPYPFRKDTPESYLDMLRTVVATYIYRDIVLKLKQEGRDFTCYLYVPEVDPATKTIHYERGDHNHILKRMATSTRECKNVSLNPEAFDKAMMDNNTGLTHAALTGQRPQSVEDAEKLLSYQVALSMEQNNFESEAEYVRTIAGWHESSDGRGLTQLQRSKFNYQMLNYILDDFMPWHREIYNFLYIDINRPMENLRGFTRETFIDITANIESQEHRRRQNNLMNYPEHPRASTTDDVECFFSMTRRQLGDTFTLKEFKSGWRKIVREFCKRLDPNIPFYYWTQNERFKLEHASFDKDNGQDKRLHVVRHNQREDSNIFTAGRSFLPARNKPSIRQRLFRLDVGLPPVPENLQHLHLR